jgi:hypothetical protein
MSAEVDIDFSEARLLGCDLYAVTSIAPLEETPSCKLTGLITSPSGGSIS